MSEFQNAIYWLGVELLDAEFVDTGHWQAQKDVPQTKTRELGGVVVNADIPEHMDDLQKEVQPDLPWAEDHFQERVAGYPTNPGREYVNWPHWRGGHQIHTGQFSHTYQERYWPKHAGYKQKEIELLGVAAPHTGIRYSYGDLNDVVRLLAKEPYTRQAYLPVWFPEDTGAHHGERVPCSLGYHFMMRNNQLHVMYSIRSCDFLRHFKNDVYLTCRLVQWLIEEIQWLPKEARTVWDEVVPGRLTMPIHSLHVFEDDRQIMEHLYESHN